MLLLDSPLLLGMDWMDPNWLLDRFGAELFWLSLVFLFIECGLFFPFLPGDTLLFAMGLFISAEKIDLFSGSPAIELLVALVLMTTAAFLGNVAGYEIGRAVGKPLYARDGRFLKKKYFDQTQVFFDKHGNKALVIGRFVPFVRTFITVVAGVTRMTGEVLVVELRGRRGLGGQHHAAGVLPRLGVPESRREHRQGDHRDPGFSRSRHRHGSESARLTKSTATRQPESRGHRRGRA